MADLRTNFKDDILSTAEEGTRKFNIVDANGNVLYESVHLEDASNYLQVGDEYGADEINAQNEVINQIDSDLSDWHTNSAVVSKGSGIITDANVYFKNGIYWCQRTDVTTDNLPERNTFGILRVFNVNTSAPTSTEPTGAIVQIWNPLPGSTAAETYVYYRVRANNAWLKWFKITALAVE